MTNALFVLWALPAVQLAQPEKVYRFEVDVRTVYVDVHVARDGKSITGLTAEDFEVFDNGVRQSVDLIDPATVPLSTMLILDTSASVAGNKLENLRSAARAFVDGLRASDEAGLLTFSHLWRLQRGLGGDPRSLQESLDQPVEIGLTGLNDALYAGVKLLEGAKGRPLLLVFTDGLNNASWLTEADLLEVVRESGAVVHMVGIRSSADAYLRSTLTSSSRAPVSASQFLNEIAKAAGGEVWFADQSADLGQVFLRVLEEMKSRYLLSYQLPEPIQEGWHSLTVKLKGGKSAEIRAREGYRVTPREGGTRAALGKAAGPR